MSTMSTVGAELGTLGKAEVVDGMYTYSQHFKNGMTSKFDDFKTHTLDLALIAFAEPEPGVSKRSELSKQVRGRELLKLPIAGVYALMSLLCIIVFAALHYPSIYAPLAYAKSKDKVIEWRVVERALEYKTAATTKIADTYTVAKSTPAGQQAMEKMSAALTATVQAYESAANSALAAKSADAADKLRGKIGAELLKLRGQRGPPASILPQ